MVMVGGGLGDLVKAVVLLGPEHGAIGAVEPVDVPLKLVPQEGPEARPALGAVADVAVLMAQLVVDLPGHNGLLVLVVLRHGPDDALPIVVVEELRSMKLKEAAKKVEDGIEETLTYCDFPSEHWTRIRTNNVIERLNREIRRRTRVVGSFPDGNSALMLVCARLRHVAGTQWGNKKYMNMKHLEAAIEDVSIAG